jgi:hypothetical protein
MSIEQATRVAAAIAACLIVAGPFAAASLIAGLRYARERLGSIIDPSKVWSVPFSTKAVLAAFLAYVAISGSPSIGIPSGREVSVVVPDDAMKQKVKAVTDAMRTATTADRLNWADVWMKSAAVVAGEATSSEVIFTDTRSLRAFTVISLEIGWRRLGGNKPGEYPGLREAVESAFKEVLSADIKPVTKDTREAYVDLARAIAWAGMAKE